MNHNNLAVYPKIQPLKPIESVRFDKERKKIGGKEKTVKSNTITNYLLFFETDPKYSGVYYNEITQSAEIHEQQGEQRTIRPWTDADTAESMRHIESKHKLYSKEKHEQALKIFFEERRYNPLINLIESFKWDGKSRCESFLVRWMKAKDSPYVREVSRLIFAGGINRLCSPGCKFDEVPILIGEQGTGKTTITKFLALNDQYYVATKNMSGDQKSIEALLGAWIVEIPELAAFRNADIESLKAFVTLQADKMRIPWDKHPKTFPRRCFFIGSTNSTAFLTDKTGNRRFYPVKVFSTANSLYSHEDELREYIAQCWAEAFARYKAGNMFPYADQTLIDEYRAAQKDAMEDDWRVGKIEEYLENKTKVCAKGIFDYLYASDNKAITMKDSREIGEIMDHSITGWHRGEKPGMVEHYGKQRFWEKDGKA